MMSILSRRYLCNLKRVKNMKQFASTARFCSDKNDDTKNNPAFQGVIHRKYRLFKSEDCTPILDIHEEKLRLSSIEPDEDEFEDYYKGLNLKRGLTGVYEIEDLLDVLKHENGLDIFVVAVPAELKYVDYICLVSGNSYKHMISIAHFVRKLYKVKKNPKDPLPRIEGQSSKEWIAMDLGNIALHIFSKEARLKYDLETLWSVGGEYDDESNKPDDPVIELLKQHSVYLGDLEPDNTKT